MSLFMYEAGIMVLAPSRGKGRIQVQLSQLSDCRVGVLESQSRRGSVKEDSHLLR